MRNRTGMVGRILCLGVALALAAGQASAEDANVKSFSAGLVWDHFSRTVVWAGDEAPSEIVTHAVSARADIGMGKGLIFSLSVGMSFSSFPDMTFSALPISLQFDSATISGIVLGAGLTAPLVKAGDIEISAAGRFVYSMGMSKTWPLEDFAVDGQAEGRPNWMELSLGPRVAYLFFGRFVPYLEASVRWLRADFRMSEVLGDLDGEEKKKVGGDLAVCVALGADAQVADRLAVVAKAGIMPFAGGVDILASAGLLYRF
jgi:hypothetical protein